MGSLSLALTLMDLVEVLRAQRSYHNIRGESKGARQDQRSPGAYSEMRSGVKGHATSRKTEFT